MSEQEKSGNEAGAEGQDEDIEKFLEQKARMEQMFKDKFTKRLSVMFTDLKGSTAIAERAGDLATRAMLKEHNDIVFPAVKENNGTLVKTIGDGTLSHFENPLDAVRAAVRIQKGMDQLNMDKKFPVPVLIRIGIHTGQVIAEKNDIFGDVVNTASRYESSANAGEIQISKETYEGLSDKEEHYIRLTKTITLKGKSEPADVYKVFWKADEIEKDKFGKRDAGDEATQGSGAGRIAKIVFAVMIPLIVVGILILAGKKLTTDDDRANTRSVTHTAQ